MPEKSGNGVAHGEPALRARRRERRALDGLLERLRAGESRVLVLRGEAGVGKSALLEHLVRQASGCRVARAAGVESEMELTYAGLHQLCVPMLDRRERLPAPQRDSLAAAFGLSAEPVPDRFVVGLAVLGLLSEVAAERPLVCVVDDAQWLDQASAQIIGFVARRLLDERVAFVCAARTCLGDDVLAGLPELAIEGLDDSAARSLLLGNVHGPLDPAVCEQIVAESHGNPLALLELPRAWNAGELAGGFGLPGRRPPASKIEQSYRRRLDLLPSETQLLVVAAAAEPLGSPTLLHRAAKALGIAMAAVAPAVDAGLIEIGGRVEFAHPLVRSAAYDSATADDRRRVHHALADASDAMTDPDRRAWHRARATPGPDEKIALELERSAGRAQARGGRAATAAFLQRSVELTEDPARRAERALVAAEASLHAGAFDAALGLVATAKADALDELQRARVDLIRGNVALASGHTNEGPRLLLKAARQLEPLDLDLARETYLTALGAATTAGHLAQAGTLPEVCSAVRALPPLPGDPRPLDLLLDGLAALNVDGHAVATPTLQRAAKALADIPVEDVLRWGWAATSASAAVWDYERFRAISARNVQIGRDAGALAQLPTHLSALALAHVWIGDFTGAASLVAESESVAAATGSRFPSSVAMLIPAFRGSEAEASESIEAAITQAADWGQGIAATGACWAAAILYNGLGRYEDARSAARDARSAPGHTLESMWALPELVEAAARSGQNELAGDALERLAETTRPCGTDWALGIETRCRALLSDGETADRLYEEAIERLSRTSLRLELARAHLLYGEWLRREGRRVNARERLRTAADMFAAIGMDAFAERARHELMATGATVRKRRIDTRDELTPQEEQIARLARGDLSNSEIAARLFLSPRTVEWHLRKVFIKLGIRSRRELARTLPAPDAEAVPA
jgi:DNA-binding CsgD family transcriptional regulator